MADYGKLLRTIMGKYNMILYVIILWPEWYLESSGNLDRGLHTATLRFGYAEPLTPARFDLHAKLADLAQAGRSRGC